MSIFAGRVESYLRNAGKTRAFGANSHGGGTLMGLLDQVIGGILGGTGQSGSPMQGVLTNLLAGNQTGQSQNPSNAGFGGAGVNTPFGGNGLSTLLTSFAVAGLGHIAQSWVSGGPNQPVSPQQLQSVLGDQQVDQMSQQAGMAPHDFLSQLSQHLPRAVDGMTPSGRVPEEGSMSV